MIIDILSDIHIDFYFKSNAIGKKIVHKVFNDILTDGGTREVGDVLIVAGDLGHDNTQNIEVLRQLQKLYYKDIVCVLGNHDYYLLNKKDIDRYNKLSQNRADEIKALIDSEPHIHLLDGDVVEIGGIRFGGAMGWYSTAYLQHYFEYKNYHKKDTSLRLWKMAMHDGYTIKGVEHFMDIYHKEYEKLLSVYRDCDIMISHVNPSFKSENQPKRYRRPDVNNTFFTFDGHYLLSGGSMKYWVFGHTHDGIEYDFEGVRCICNPFGYPNERSFNDATKIKSISL